MLPREVGRAATVVRCQVATPRPPCRCIANVLLRWSAQTAPRRKRAAVRGPRGSRFDAAQWAKREPGGSVRLEGCIQDGSLGYCATERVACAATAPLNVSHPGKRCSAAMDTSNGTAVYQRVKQPYGTTRITHSHSTMTLQCDTMSDRAMLPYQRSDVSPIEWPMRATESRPPTAAEVQLLVRAAVAEPIVLPHLLQPQR